MRGNLLHSQNSLRGKTLVSEELAPFRLGAKVSGQEEKEQPSWRAP